MISHPSLPGDIQQQSDRPIFTHLNGDTCWLWSFPRSRDDVNQFGRAYYHILVDPWLDGDLVVYFSLFMVLKRTFKSAYSTIAQVQDLIKQIEASGSVTGRLYNTEDDSGNPDAIFISTFLHDHCPRPILEQFLPTIPVIASKEASSLVRSWSHFAIVETMTDLDLAKPESLWQTTITSSLLPRNLRIGRLPSGPPPPGLHWAQLIAYTSPSSSQLLGTPICHPETILYTPHGIYASRFSSFSFATTHSTPLAVFHGLASATSPQQANLGVDNGRKLVEAIKPKYWIPTHDEDGEYGGIMAWFQTKTQGVFPAEGVERGDGEGKVICKEFANGECMVMV